MTAPNPFNFYQTLNRCNGIYCNINAYCESGYCNNSKGLCDIDPYQSKERNCNNDGFVWYFNSTLGFFQTLKDSFNRCNNVYCNCDN